MVINADSAQVYADLAVLSARPSPEDMRGIEHRLFGEWDGAESCSAADWAKRAAAEVAAIHAAGGVPILVGGTGLYIRTLLDGIAPIPTIDPAIRTTVRAIPQDEAYAALEKEDPARAAQLAPGDGSRIARALEVIRSTGRSLLDWHHAREGGIGAAVTLHPLLLLPDRATLYACCDDRFALMLVHGAVDEVRALLARNLDPDLPVMRAIGVPEIAAFLRSEASLAETAALGAQATRNYAKRQFTWFRRQTPDDWPKVESLDYAIDANFASLLRN